MTLTVNVELVEADYLALARHQIQHGKRWREARSGLWGWGMLCVLVAVAPTLYSGYPITAAHVFVLAGVAVVLALTSRRMKREAFIRIQKWGRSRRGHRWMEPTDVSIDERGISWIATDRSISLGWPLVADIVQSSRHIFVFVDEEAALIIPQRTFPSETAATDFLYTMRQSWRARSSLEDHCPKCQYILQGLETHGCPECGWRREA